MIKQKDQLTTTTVSNVRGGQGDLLRADIFSADEMLDKVSLCAVMTIPHGSSVGLHPHETDAEIYYILSGTLRMTDNGITKDLVAGDTIFTGGGTSHGYENVSGADASVLSIIIK